MEDRVEDDQAPTHRGFSLAPAFGDSSPVFELRRVIRVMDELRDKVPVKAPESLPVLGLFFAANDEDITGDASKISGVALSADLRGRGEREAWLSGVRLRDADLGEAVLSSARPRRIAAGVPLKAVLSLPVLGLVRASALIAAVAGDVPKKSGVAALSVD